MNTKVIQEFIWRMRGFLSALGWPGIVATVFALSILSGYFFVLKPLREEIFNLKADTKNSQKKSRALLQEVKTLGPVEQLLAFYRFFPTEDQISDDMEKIYAAASEQGIVLERGDYQLVSERDSKLLRYDIAFPVKGGYLQVRKFIAQVLKDVPTVSLSSIIFSRERIGDPLLDVQLKFALYLRPS